MSPKSILQYQSIDGRVPFREWLLDLRDLEARAKIRSRLDRLALGNPGDCRPVGGGVHELRFHFGPGYRVYFAQQGSVIVVLLCGGDKRSQAKDIRLAQDYWEDYRRRAHETR